MPSKHKWATPLDWLLDYLGRLDQAQYTRAVARIIVALDADTIQDLYQDEMDKDGYFEETLHGEG